jgi:Zn-dependent M28 family amino/carboxypeptidase
VLAVAKAFAANDVRPRRSIAFMLFTAEEKGLWGSSYFVEKPPFPLEKIVLEIQLDMIGRNEESRSGDPKKAEKADDNVRTLHVVGSKRRSLELDPWIHALNSHTGLGFEYDQEDVYTRSDQWSFASRGIPVVFFFAGFHPDYHQPSDTPEKINYEKVSLVARLVFGLAFEVADREKRLAIHRL